MIQTYKVQVSMNQAHLVEPGFVWKQGDFGFNLEIEVLDFDTSGVTPQIIFRKSAGAVESTSVTQSSNKFTYTIRGTELDTPGPCICDLKLKNSTTQRISTASFKYFVLPDTEDGLDQEANSYSDTIAQLIGRVEDYSKDAEAWAAGTINGTPVSSSAEQYHNNSKYYSDLASDLSEYSQETIRSAFDTNNLAYEIDFEDGYLSADGESINPTSDYVTSDYIDLQGSSSVAINKALRYALYNSSKAKLLVVNPSSENFVVALGSNVKYLRFTLAKTDKTSSVVMLTNNASDLSDITWDLKNSPDFESVKTQSQTAYNTSSNNEQKITNAINSNNLVFSQDFVNGYLSSDGASINPTNDYVTSDYIYIHGQASVGVNKALRYAIYGVDKSVLLIVGSPDPNTNIIIPIGNNAYYLRFTIAQEDKVSSVVMFTSDASDFSNITYDFTKSNVANIANNAYNQSLKNADIIDKALYTNNLLAYTTFINGYLSADGASINATDDYKTTDYIEVHKGEVSFINVLRFTLYNSDKQALGTYNPSPSNESYSLTLGSNVAYIRGTISVNQTAAIITFGDNAVAIWKPKYEVCNIRVGSSSECDFDDIQSAIDSILDDSATKPYVIYIEPGTYGRINMRTGKTVETERVRYISLIGLSSCEDTIIYDDKGNYDDSPGEIFNTGVIKNLSFINNTSVATKEPSQLHDYAFALHVGAFALGTGAVNLVIEDCYCFSNAGAAFGCGTMQDNTIVVRNSKFVSDNDTECNGAPWQGGFYLHTNGLSETTNQNLKIYNSWIQSKCYTNGAAIQERTGYTSHLNFEICNTAIIGTNGPALELHQNITPVFGSFNNLPNTLNNLTPSN